MLRDAGIDPSPLWTIPGGWSEFGPALDRWIADSARGIAFAVVAACSVIDFPAAVIDGGFPAEVRDRLVEAVASEVAAMDLQGIEAPRIVAGKVGPAARAIGGASLPLFKRFLLDRDVLLKENAHA